MSDWRSDRVESALAGENPTVLAELDHSFAVIGDVQWLPGYSFALTKMPGVDRLSRRPPGGCRFPRVGRRDRMRVAMRRSVA